MTALHLEGSCAPGFEAVRDAFCASFEEGLDRGAALCVMRRGEVLVDLAAGVADDAGRPYTRDTLQLVYSTTKGLTTLAALAAHDAGLLDLEAPVSRYWPELLAGQRYELPVRQLLSHQAGLPVVDVPVTPDDVLGWTGIVRALELQEPLWEPGTAHGYHALTFGWLVGEVLRRTTGRSPGTWFRDCFGDPWSLDTWIGLPAEQEQRVSPLRPGAVLVTAEQAALLATAMAPPSLAWRAMSLDGMAWDSDEDPFNRPDLHRAELPAANGITTARSLARLYDGVLGPDSPVRRSTLDRARECRTAGIDRVLQVASRFGTGFALLGPGVPFLGDASFGHTGSGGSLAFADVDAEVAVGYVMNATVTTLGSDPRAERIVTALRECLST